MSFCVCCRYQRCLGVGMKPSWVLSADERERRFRKSKAKKLKTEDEECNDMITAPTAAVANNPTEENVLFMIPSTAVSNAAVLQNIKLESVMETDGATAMVRQPSSSGAKVSQNLAPITSLSSLLPMASVSGAGPSHGDSGGHASVSSGRYVQLCYPSPVVTTVVTPVTLDSGASGHVSWYRSPDTSGHVSGHSSPGPLDLSSEDDAQSNYSRSSGSDRDHSSPVNVMSLVTEPEVKFTAEELHNLNMIVEKHDERYRSVSFGEQLIKEIIMCR